MQALPQSFDTCMSSRKGVQEDAELQIPTQSEIQAETVGQILEKLTPSWSLDEHCHLDDDGNMMFR